MRHRGALVVAAVAAAGLVLGAPFGRTEAAPNQLVQYQGRLVDSNGVPLEGTIARLAVRLYSTPTPTPASFIRGEVFTNVAVSRGVFTIYLGAGAARLDAAGAETPGAQPFTDEFDSGEARYVEVQVNTDAPLAPLTQLGAVPFALAAAGTVPLGAIIDWYRPSTSITVPPGWALLLSSCP